MPVGALGTGQELFAEDTAVCALAEHLGLSLSRFESIEITDESAIKAAGLMRETPDYRRIRKALQSGLIVPGARLLGGVEYKLRSRTPLTPVEGVEERTTISPRECFIVLGALYLFFAICWAVTI